MGTGLPDNGNVIAGRVEETARIPELVEAFDLVTARSFGPPAVTAECGAQFLRVGGVMIVSEPPDDSDNARWNSAKLGDLGLVAQGRVRHVAVPTRCWLRLTRPRMSIPEGLALPESVPSSDVSRETIWRIAALTRACFSGNTCDVRVSYLSNVSRETFVVRTGGMFHVKHWYLTKCRKAS